MWYTNKGKGGERKKNIANTYVRRHLDQIAVHLFSKWVSPTFGYYSTTIIAINFLKFFSQILKQIFLLNFFKYIFYFAFGFTLHLLQIHVRTGCFTFFYIKKLYFENYSFPACVAWTGCHNFAIISANYKRAHVLLHFFGFLRYVLCFYISAIKLYAISIFFRSRKLSQYSLRTGLWLPHICDVRKLWSFRLRIHRIEYCRMTDCHTCPLLHATHCRRPNNLPCSHSLHLTSPRFSSVDNAALRSTPHLVTVRLIVFKVTLLHYCELSYIYTLAFLALHFVSILLHIYFLSATYLSLQSFCFSFFPSFFSEIRAISASHRPLWTTHTYISLHCIALFSTHNCTRETLNTPPPSLLLKSFVLSAGFSFMVAAY